uniref:Uncharacterized protein n=1 Tax=Timema shepardi TaxID=629360 RepID=A0A7R9AZS9_TIMSH|nr:unnamed protein product [Timema shepardi]
MKPTPRVSVEEIEDFDQGVVRRAIYGMYDRNEHVTLDALLDVIRANTGPDTASLFEGRRTTLYKLLHKIGFSWQKSGRKVLMEDVNVDAKRIAFLREYRKLAVENNNFVFLDETWIFSTRLSESFGKKPLLESQLKAETRSGADETQETGQGQNQLAWNTVWQVVSQLGGLGATTPILSTAWTAPQSMSSEPSKCIQRQRELLSLLARVMVTVSHVCSARPIMVKAATIIEYMGRTNQDFSPGTNFSANNTPALMKSSAAFTPLALQTGKYSSCRLAAILFVLETLAKERAAGQFDSIGESQRKLSKPLYLQLWNQCLYGPHLNTTLLIQSGTQSAGAECVSSHSSYVPGAGSTVRYYVSKPRNKRTTKDREKWAQDHELR